MTFSERGEIEIGEGWVRDLACFSDEGLTLETSPSQTSYGG